MAASTHPICRELEAALGALADVEAALKSREPPGARIAAFLDTLKSVERVVTAHPEIPIPAGVLEPGADWDALACKTMADTLSAVAESTARRAHARDLADLVESTLAAT